MFPPRGVIHWMADDLCCCSQTGVPRCSYIGGMLRFPAAFSQLATAQFHLIIYSEAVLHCTVHTAGIRLVPSSGLLEGLTVFAANAGLVVGSTSRSIPMENSGPRI